MPKSQNPKLVINLDLLRPQSNPEKLPIKLIRWLLSTGRYIFIFVEAIVLVAFILRFKLDADLQANKESIEQQIPYIESLRPSEILIRQTQLKLSTIRSLKPNYIDYSKIINSIADQTPAGVKITSLNLEKNLTRVAIRLNGRSKNNQDLANFVGGLKQDKTFSDVTIVSVGFEKGDLNFSLSLMSNAEGKNL